ncbi:MAG: hypothetical protein QOJ00_1323 [Actinomycetota bacterium]
MEAPHEAVTERDYRPLVVLAVMMAVYVAVFGHLTWRQQSNYGTFGYDMGLHDQAIWLMSRFQAPFMTIRGLNYFGHHVDLISVLFVPIYWLGGGPHALYFVETLALAAAAIPIWLLGRDLMDPYLALVPAGAYLLHPSTEWINWWHFHPDALVITPLMFAWWLATRRRWRWFAVCVVIALATKEDAALAVTAMGVALMFRGERRPGAWTFGAGVFWFLVCTKLIIPITNGGGSPFYEDFFPGLGTSLPQILFNAIRHPSRVYHPMFAADRLVYFRKLLLPLALLPFVAPLALLVSAPQTAVNTIASHSPSHDIRFHYSAIILVGLMIATVEGVARLARRGDGLKIAVVALLCVSAFMGNREWSPSPIGRDYKTGIWAQHNPREAAFNAAVHEVRPGDKVAATYLIDPHLTHRKYIYEFPNPWHIVNWDPTFRNAPPRLATCDTLVLDTQLLGDAADLYAQLTSAPGPFRIVFSQDGVIVARRKHAPDAYERALNAEQRKFYVSQHP